MWLEYALLRGGRCAVSAALCAGLTLAFCANHADADEGGASFWLPGLVGSLVAVPAAPGPSLGTFLYHSTADASASATFFDGGSIVSGLHAHADLALLNPTYTFATPVLAGQAAVSAIAGFGQLRVSTDATLTGPAGGQAALGKSDSIIGGTDLEVMGSLKWHGGDHNYMTYVLVGAPTGAYQVERLANLGLNHWSIDAGGAYTYFTPGSRREFSVLAGVTYNFENPDTHYRSGIDGHVDWAASHFFSDQLHAGLVGYFYHQLTADSSPYSAILGDFESRTNGIGPQVGYFFPFAGGKGYVNLKAYWEFGASHRAEGWNAWLTLALPLGAAP